MLTLTLTSCAEHVPLQSSEETPIAVFEGDTVDITNEVFDDTSSLYPPEEDGIPAVFEIPRYNKQDLSYQTWSLLLVCNPHWLRWVKTEDINDFYDTMRVFGGAIGPRHLAVNVWFWRAPRDWIMKENASALVSYIDVNRGAEFCDHYDLEASKGPFVLVTKTYPDINTAPGEYIAICLNGLDAKYSSELLSFVAGQMFRDALNHKGAGCSTLLGNAKTRHHNYIKNLKHMGGALADRISEVKITMKGIVIRTNPGQTVPLSR